MPYQTVISISESPKKAGLIYAGTDDGRLHVSIDAGKEWTDLTARLPTQHKWVAKVLASQLSDEGTVYLAQQGRYDDDFARVSATSPPTTARRGRASRAICRPAR